MAAKDTSKNTVNKKTLYLGTLTILAMEKAFQSDAISLVLAIQWWFSGLEGTIKHQCYILTKTILTHKQIVQINTGIVIFAIMVLSPRDAPFGLKGYDFFDEY